MYKGTIGATIRFNVLESLVGKYSEVGFVVNKPGSTEDVKWIGEVRDNTKICYTIKSGDLDLAGKYSIQGYVKNSDGSILFTDIKYFIVEETL